MKYELTDMRKQISDIEIINDLRTVAKNLGKKSLKMSDYCKENGAIFNFQTAKKRFGNWDKVMETAGLETEKSIHGIEYGETSLKEELLISDLIRVSRELKNPKFSIADYNEFGKYGSATIQKRFGGWNHAKIKANLDIGRNYNSSVDDYMQNILDLWTHFGRQPKYSEVVKPISKFHISAYENKFGTWRKALESFIQYINDGQAETDEIIQKENIVELNSNYNLNSEKKKVVETKKTPRNINLRLRWRILQRDNFSCKKCGNSPAKNPNIELHVDHIIPWSKGGETVFENLETLCSICNLGKSNLM
jgi:HNH endonuclease/Homing endonuclease associated repeat